MGIVVQTPEPDEQAQPEPTIPVLVDKIGAALTRLLRLVRPAEAGPIRETVDELEAVLGALLETALRQAQSQATGVFAPFLDQLEQIEARVTAIEDARAREVGGP